MWTPINIRIGVVYGFLAQFETLGKIVFYGSGLYFLWFHVLPGRKLLVIWFLASLGIWVGLGEVLIRWNIPQKMTEKGNKINPQLDAINEILENSRKLLKK